MDDKHTETEIAIPVAASENPTKIEMIKNLIFGDTIATYDAELDALKTDLVAKKKELEHFTEEIKRELLQNLDSLGTDIHTRITDLEAKIEERLSAIDFQKTDKKKLGEFLIALGHKVSE